MGEGHALAAALLQLQLLPACKSSQKASLVLKRVLCLQNREAMNAAIALHDQVSPVHLSGFKAAMQAGPVQFIPRQHVLGAHVETGTAQRLIIDAFSGIVTDSWCARIQRVRTASDTSWWLLQIMRSRLSRHYGYEVTTEGDAFLMVGPLTAECMLLCGVSALTHRILLLQAFYEASDAVSWAVETQQVSRRHLLATVNQQWSCTSCCQASI